MTGKTVGEFRIEAQVSSGGMGTVYRATHAQTGQLAAVKVLQHALAADRSFLQRFRREVIALQKVQHPNVVRIYDVGCEGDVHYYVMEYLDKSLTDVMRAGPVELCRAVQVASQVARGLAAVHAAGIRHRDVKPSNILFDAEGTAKVADFGIAKFSDATRVTQTGVIVGTPTYMAPEQVDDTNVGARADIYSLGVVLYEMVVGRPPFDGSTTLDILRKHRYTLPESPKSFKPEVPGALAHLILGMLAKNPSKRPDTMAMVADALEHIAENMASGGVGPSRAASGRVLTPAEQTERYERSAAVAARWGKRLAALAAAALLGYLGYRLVAYWRLTAADYWRAAQALEATDQAQAAEEYDALIRRFPDAPEATVARGRVRALQEEQRRRYAKGRSPGIAPSDKAASLRAETAYIHYCRAERAAREGDIAHARQIYLWVRAAFADTPWGARADQRLHDLDASAPKQPDAPPGKGAGEPKAEEAPPPPKAETPEAPK
ncbi:MAG TPA: serine/threonine-protein kinase [Planctomycetota bacterium]|nr:serine/threonine-protein kinase [Planctomycetota bacterium]